MSPLLTLLIIFASASAGRPEHGNVHGHHPHIQHHVSVHKIPVPVVKYIEVPVPVPVIKHVVKKLAVPVYKPYPVHVPVVKYVQVPYFSKHFSFSIGKHLPFSFNGHYGGGFGHHGHGHHVHHGVGHFGHGYGFGYR